ncbi:MAG: hypothetical protein ACLFU1_03870 [Alphaproteobacteria bacterium]
MDKGNIASRVEKVKDMKKIFGIVCASMLAACSPLEKKGEPLPQMTFNHVDVYPLYVASFEVKSLPFGQEPAAPLARSGPTRSDRLAAKLRSYGQKWCMED